ncbi:MAG TPA: hypothetical protein VJ785_04425 [Anaerolineales bacterium]|nr:hypothetical protein [Anaerolineales bacterium]
MNSKEFLQKLGHIPFYPLLFVAFPVLSLMGNNINEVEPSLLWRPLMVSLLVALILLVVLRLLLRDWYRAAVLLSILIFLFFIYGHIYFYLKKVEFAGLIIGRHRHMAPLWVGLIILAAWWVSRSLRNPRKLTPILNLVSAFLLVLPTFQIVSYVVERERTERAALESAQTKGVSLPLGYAPDVYYIILDAYGRQDVLMEMFEFDNSAFIDSLEAKGFYVAQCTQSNYGQTMLSLTSSLNFDYLDSLTSDLTEDTDRRAPLRALGQYNNARQFFDSQGYNIVSFATNFPVSEWMDADTFLAPPPAGMTDFELMLSQTSAWRIPMDMVEESPEKRSADWYRTRTKFALEQMEEVVPQIAGPKFVFAHLVIPHHPFVFGPNGEELTYDKSGVPEFDEYRVKYPDQVIYVNQRIEAIIDLILETSPKQPIIIIQGDHGPAPFDVPERRMKILNAYYFPDDTEGLYPTITPVNTFRLILNKYFLQDVPMLEDRSLFSEYDVPYNYQEIPNDCQP